MNTRITPEVQLPAISFVSLLFYPFKGKNTIKVSATVRYKIICLQKGFNKRDPITIKGNKNHKKKESFRFIIFRLNSI